MLEKFGEFKNTTNNPESKDTNNEKKAKNFLPLVLLASCLAVFYGLQFPGSQYPQVDQQDVSKGKSSESVVPVTQVTQKSGNLPELTQTSGNLPKINLPEVINKLSQKPDQNGRTLSQLFTRDGQRIEGGENMCSAFAAANAIIAIFQKMGIPLALNEERVVQEFWPQTKSPYGDFGTLEGIKRVLEKYGLKVKKIEGEQIGTNEHGQPVISLNLQELRTFFAKENGVIIVGIDGYYQKDPNGTKVFFRLGHVTVITDLVRKKEKKEYKKEYFKLKDSYGMPEEVEPENMVIGWAAEVYGYPPKILEIFPLFLLGQWPK